MKKTLASFEVFSALLCFYESECLQKFATAAVVAFASGRERTKKPGIYTHAVKRREKQDFRVVLDFFILPSVRYNVKFPEESFIVARRGGTTSYGGSSI